MTESVSGIIVGLFAIGLAWYWHPSPPSDNHAEIGRYQIIRENDYRAYLLDTVSGDSYSWVINTDEKGQKTYEGWEEAPNLAIISNRANPLYIK